MSINEDMTDWNEALARVGDGVVLDDSEYQYPPAKWVHPHAARPGTMPNVADLVAENAKLRDIVLRIAGRDLTDDMGECMVCRPGKYEPCEPTCPARLAAEYVAGLEVKP